MEAWYAGLTCQSDHRSAVSRSKEPRGRRRDERTATHGHLAHWRQDASGNPSLVGAPVPKTTGQVFVEDRQQRELQWALNAAEELLRQHGYKVRKSKARAPAHAHAHAN